MKGISSVLDKMELMARYYDDSFRNMYIHGLHPSLNAAFESLVIVCESRIFLNCMCDQLNLGEMDYLVFSTTGVLYLLRCSHCYAMEIMDKIYDKKPINAAWLVKVIKLYSEHNRHLFDLCNNRGSDSAINASCYACMQECIVSAKWPDTIFAK